MDRLLDRGTTSGGTADMTPANSVHWASMTQLDMPSRQARSVIKNLPLFKPDITSSTENTPSDEESRAT